MFDLATATLEQLKAKYFDILREKERAENTLQVLVQAINRREQEEATANSKNSVPVLEAVE